MVTSAGLEKAVRTSGAVQETAVPVNDKKGDGPNELHGVVI